MEKMAASDHNSTGTGNIEEVYNDFDEDESSEEDDDESSEEDDEEESSDEFEDEEEGSEDDEEESDDEEDDEYEDLEAGEEEDSDEEDTDAESDSTGDSGDMGDSENTEDIFDNFTNEPNYDKKPDPEDVETRRRRYLIYGLIGFVVLIVALLLGRFLGWGKDDDKETSKPQGLTTLPSAAPSPFVADPESNVTSSNSPSAADSSSPSVAPSLKGSPAPTEVGATASPTLMPTLDPDKTYFPALGDTYIADGDFADQPFATSETLEIVATSDLISVALLQFDLAEMPPEADSILLESSIVLRLFRAGSLSSSAFSDITVSRLDVQDDIDIDTFTWNDFTNVSVAEGLVDGPTFTVSSETEMVEVQIKELLQPEIELRRLGRELQERKIFLVLQMPLDEESTSIGDRFRSSEAGATVSPVIVHEYVDAVITSCLVEPCGLFASCWELDGGEVVCECDSSGDRVNYLEACPVGTCQQNRILDSVAQTCVCPPERPEEDSEGFCFAVGSPCLDDPCGGIGAICNDDSTETAGYSCRCSDDSVVSDAEDCDPTTITSCDPPNPCGLEAYCYATENSQGVKSIGCECEDGSEVALGVDCAVPV